MKNQLPVYRKAMEAVGAKWVQWEKDGMLKIQTYYQTGGIFKSFGKGFCYSEKELETYKELKTDLGGGTWYRHLEGNWYLYYHHLDD